jgi:predicted GIY-YIG superfamily endonuclease
MQVIYALIDPRDMKEFYVGRTEDLYRRFREHLACTGFNDAKNKRIKELQSLQLVPIMKTLELVEDAAIAGQREAYWIRHFRYLGYALSNDTVISEIAEENYVMPVILQRQRRKKKLTRNVYTSDEASRIAKCSLREIKAALEHGRLSTAKNSDKILKSSLEKFIAERQRRS